ncbi:MAG TPA: alkaline phosphatase D family protein, partial [Chitinophagales bacterium]|nr:alkaline phosphatase D family protein [Chitinophagales bacterium]
MKKAGATFAILLIAFLGFSQNPEKPRLIAWPLVGGVTQTTACVWLAYRGDGQNMVSLMDTLDKQSYFPSGFHKISDRKGNTALIADFKGLLPAHVYKVVIPFDPLLLKPKCFFTTQSDSAVKDMDFLFGSCALLNTDISRIVFPGGAQQIFGHMKKQRTDFMVWLGDNLYYFHKHYTSYDGMFKRNLTIRRSYLSLAEFLAAQPNYAIWDDHDYGWNDSDKKFPLKDSSLVIFKGFWPNPYPAEQPFKGNYFTFRYYDAEFFMTDDRWYRDSPGDTMGAYFGAEQVKWLKEALKASKATFKFICTGSQVLNDSYYGESYAKYPHERDDLLSFIADNNITGVIFLTGDKHYTELSKRDWNGYP